MRKMIFAVLAALVMSLGFMSCSSSSPEKKLIGLMEDVVSILKDTHIKSADDVAALKDKMETIKKDVMAVTTELMDSYKDKSPEELAKLAESMKDLEKQSDKLSKEIEAEGERLEKEAEAAGVELGDLDVFD